MLNPDWYADDDVDDDAHSAIVFRPELAVKCMWLDWSVWLESVSLQLQGIKSLKLSRICWLQEFSLDYGQSMRVGDGASCSSINEYIVGNGLAGVA